ncbi:MAG: hypothetical protein AB1348_06215 [Nitrospirota bacterium]
MRKLDLIISFIVFFSLSISYAGTVIVKPGKFDHFTLQVPDRIIAGESFVIKALVYDSNNNLITNFSESGKEFKVSATGSAHVQPSLLGLTSFPGGAANITVTDKKAETVVFSIYEAEGTVPVISKEIVISPNRLDHFILQSPAEVTAGSSFDVRVVAKDVFDNTVSDTEIGKNIRITSSGTSPLKILGPPTPDFKNGTASISFVSEKVGDAIVQVQEVSTGSKGQSQSIVVNPAALSYFRLQSPKEVVAGEPFEITVTAYDSYANLVHNYTSGGNGVSLYSTGHSKIEPSFIKPSEFKNGQATINVTYERAEDIVVIAREHNKTQEGKSSSIKVTHAPGDHFVVVTPDVAISGQRFKIKIEVYDRYNNIAKNYNLTGNDVLLRTTGTGVISPSIISPSEFVDGIAMVEVTYDKAESFAISASMAAVRAGRMTIKEQEPEKVVTEKIEQIPIAKVERPQEPFNLNKVSIIEAKEKAMLVFNISASDGTLEYRDARESKDGREWLKLTLRPAIRKTEKSMKFRSAFIGNVLVEEDKSEKNVVNVYIELISKGIKFDIARVKDSLIITVAKP